MPKKKSRNKPRKVTEDKRRAADRKHFLVTGEPSIENGFIDLRDFAPTPGPTGSGRYDERAKAVPRRGS